MKYEYVLKADTIYTLNEEKPQVEWVAVKDGKISMLGNGPVPEEEKVIDFGNNVVIPGLIDSHVHGCNAGVMYAAVNLIECTSIPQVLQLVEERCLNTEDDLVLATNFIPWLIEENRFPTIQELDSISHGKTVQVISITLHTSAINTAAYESMDFSTFEFGIEKDEDGNFNGYLSADEPNFYAMGTLMGRMSDEKLSGYIDDFAQAAVSLGLTTCHCLEGGFLEGDKDVDIWLDKMSRNEIPFHAVIYPQVWNYDEAKDRWNLHRHGGCLTLDGADADFSMALSEPYASKPEVRGFLYHKDSEIYNLTSKAYADGKQICFHAMGDRAIDQVINIYKQVIMEQGQKDLRLRIEHFTLPSQEHMEMARDLGIVVSQQPEYPYLYGEACVEVFGEKRANEVMEQYKKEIDMGIAFAGGSDAPVNSLNPLSGLHGLVNSDNPGRKLSVTEALKAYTYWSAYAAFEENERGTIKEGYYADFTVLSDDPYKKPESIIDFSVKGTISEGRLVYDAR